MGVPDFRRSPKLPAGAGWELFVGIGIGALVALCCALRICKACKDCERDREVAAQRAEINAINAGLIANQQQVGIMSHAQFLANQQQAATTPPISFAAPTPPIQTAVPVGTDVEAAETPEAMPSSWSLLARASSRRRSLTTRRRSPQASEAVKLRELTCAWRRVRRVLSAIACVHE